MGFKSFLFGKKFGPSAMDLSIKDDMEKAQKRSINAQIIATNKLQQLATQAPDFVRTQVAREERQERGSMQDQLRSIRERVAQRGLGRSALGLQAENQAQRGFLDRLNAIRASTGERMRAATRGASLDLMGAGATLGQSAAAGMASLAPRLKSGRRGGMAGALLGGAGAIIGAKGGPQGAKAGFDIGRGVGGALGGMAN